MVSGSQFLEGEVVLTMNQEPGIRNQELMTIAATDRQIDQLTLRLLTFPRTRA
jgi:hypothetical protein